MDVAVQLHDKNAKLPTFSHETDACADLYSTEELTIGPNQSKLVGTGISLELYPGWEAQIRPRSGLALKHGITVLNTPGTIDADYRGEIKVILVNHSKEPYTVKTGDRIAQMAVRRVPEINFVNRQSLSQTVRADSGFGSTGK